MREMQICIELPYLVEKVQCPWFQDADGEENEDDEVDASKTVSRVGSDKQKMPQKMNSLKFVE